MPGARDELRKEAFEMFRHGSRLKDIADQLGVPAGTVRRWKCTDKWVEATGGKANVQKANANTKSERSEGRKERRKYWKAAVLLPFLLQYFNVEKY